MRAVGRLGVVAVVMAIFGPGLTATGASAAGGGGCALKGSATFLNGGPGAPPGGSWNYQFSGALSSCKSSPNEAFQPTGGTVSAGEPITFVDTAGNTVTESEPLASGTGSCAESTTSGVAFVDWGGGQWTILKYATAGAGPLVVLNGTSYVPMQSGGALASYTFPDGATLAATQFSDPNSGSVGAFAFQPASPTECETQVTAAAITGFVGIGSAG